MDTTQLTIQLPQSDVIFLENFTKRHKVTIADLLANFIKQLRAVEIEYSFHPDIKKFSGIIPKEVDAKTVYYDYLEEKHK
jgi:hypothetical protein